MAKTFKGGIHVPDSKHTRNHAITEFPAPATVSIPMQQHIGAPASALVKKGDHVCLGEVIGRFDSGPCKRFGHRQGYRNASLLYRFR